MSVEEALKQWKTAAAVITDGKGWFRQDNGTPIERALRNADTVEIVSDKHGVPGWAAVVKVNQKDEARKPFHLLVA
jgi:hypothetical protein